jgi:hypothetical protein
MFKNSKVKTLKNIILLLVILSFFPVTEILAFTNGLETPQADTLVYLPIPPRASNALTGSQFASKVTGMSVEDREQQVVNEILSGNVPSFSRKLRLLKVRATIENTNYELAFYTACDYMAIGSDEDYLYIPMTPKAAQFLVNRVGCTLPTKKMVDIIYANAEIKLHPQPIPPSPQMTTIPVFMQHTDSIRQQIAQLGFDRSANFIIGGHKKDVIISNKIYSPDRSYDRVVIYGWHRAVGDPIQPVYNGHIAGYADYSHGIRFILNMAFLNGDSVKVTDILKNSKLASLLSNEGVIAKPYYPAGNFTSLNEQTKELKMGFKLYQNFPNPFGKGSRGNSTTTIKYSIPMIETQRLSSPPVTLKIYDILGRTVATLVNEEQPPGNYSIQFSANGGMSSGVYIYQLKVGGFQQSGKMIFEE